MDKYDLADPLGVLRKEDLESVELLWNTLDVIQAIDTNNELDALEFLLQRSNPLLYLGLLESFVKLFWINTNGEGADSDILILELDAVWSSR